MITIIPPRYYHDPAVFALEQKSIFARNWHCIGLRWQLEKHNDFLCHDVGGFSIAVHNFTGQLRAFHNVCSHRFNRIHPAGEGNRPLQCSYHGWTYDETGLPSAIPKRPRFDDLTPEKLCSLRLTAWRVETCGQLVFVCGDPKAHSLADFLGTSFAVIEQLTNACGAQIDKNEMTIRANWKVLVENTLESYHVGFIHPNIFSRLNAGEGKFEWQPPHSSWITPLGPKFAGRMGKLLHLFETRPVKIEGYFHQLIFPNVTVATTQGTSFSVQFFEPIGPGETRFISLVFQTKLGEITAGTQTAVEALNQSVTDFNRAVFGEDKEVCEQVQLGVAETAQTGILSDEELRVGDFQAHYMRLLETPL